MRREGWRRESARHSLAARGVGTKPRKLRRGIPYKSKTEGALTIEGKVTGLSKPKEYQAYGGGWIEKFFVEVVDATGKVHKAMVYNLTNRERPFRGDMVRYTTRDEKNDWGSVTEKQDFEVLSHEGKESWIAYKHEQEAKEEAERQVREAEQRKHEAEERLRRQQEYERGRALAQKFEKNFRRVVGDYGADMIEDVDYNRDMTERMLKGVRQDPHNSYTEDDRAYHAFVGAGLLSLKPGATPDKDVYALTDTGKKVLAQMEAGRL